MFKASLVLCSIGALLVSCDNDSDSAISTNIVTLTATEYLFTPNQFQATVGSSVTVMLQNQGSIQHSLLFILPGGDVEMSAPVKPGATGHLNFTAPAAGRYTFYCPIDGHQALGMLGSMVVTAAAAYGGADAGSRY